MPASTNVVSIFTNGKAACPAWVQGACAGTLLAFPARDAGTFTPGMRSSLRRLASGVPGMAPVVFDVDEGGNEVCRLADHVTVGWDRKRRLCLVDLRSGFVDHGPFKDVDEICDLIACIGV